MLFSEPKIPQFIRPLRCSILSTLSFSALQRAENSSIPPAACVRCMRASFSALQRAENSSSKHVIVRDLRPARFQCSSASRKFLKTDHATPQQKQKLVSVLFSEPKIPQPCQRIITMHASDVSVLFSEPKIPQLAFFFGLQQVYRSFSALQRAENSSTGYLTRRLHYLYQFQCSSASRKFLNLTRI